MLQKIGFSASEAYFIAFNSLQVAGLLIASFGGVKSDDQTIVNEAYSTRPTYEHVVKEGKQCAYDIPQRAIRDAVGNKVNYILGFLFTAIGMWLSTWIETTMPNKYALIGILLMTILWCLLGLAVRTIVCFIKVKRIITKLKNGNLSPQGGISFEITETITTEFKE